MRLRPPRFWTSETPHLAARALTPVSAVVSRIAQQRSTQPGYHASVPVLCCGNATTGGTGKTPLTLDFVRRLQARGHTPHILSRGHGGKQHGPLAVNPSRYTARDVGDEPMLLSACAPTWIGANRGNTAQLAVSEGADCLVMDDGFQNTTLNKTLSLLIVDGASGFGNQRVLPSGPLRESLENAFARAHAIILIGDDRRHIHRLTSLPILQARFIPGPEIRRLQGVRVIAFAGIGRPEKFFTMLREAGIEPVRTLSFPDHHNYTPRDIQRLDALRLEANTTLVTTAKDAVKLPPTFRAHTVIISVDVLWEDPTAPDHILDQLFA
ncbi:tetraacyldisaccharide 4'-kinase [Neokomagataea thailandica]|uniref:Tetraacyldisaccharide 4'-kinase n=1 Tax=Neokomagataea tanensis NBRC 106556 TaxID=1223519 RepID=A0ABQ0QLN9_9PROT|nr:MULTISPECIES: tetraacyldisaccharide 4'-kinase [Neokomagataea]GBR49510.1 tetraacyldisaccharide 4'-kinase [Neokomagataea tanensis NBRC 106556]